MHFKQFHFFKRDLQKGPKCYEKMHGLGIIQKVQQYLKLVRIFWRNCLEFFSFQMNGEADPGFGMQGARLGVNAQDTHIWQAFRN